MKSVLAAFLNLLYPNFCCNCGRIGALLCQRCQLQADFFLHPLHLNEASHLDTITICFHYTPPISKMIQDMKFHSVIGVCQILGECLYYHTNYPDAEAVTCVPVSNDTSRSRGFNQAEQIARQFSGLTKIPYVALLEKAKASKAHQAKLRSRQARLKNIHEGTFVTKAKTKLPATVLLIDDVYTTGATLESCSQALKMAGVTKVHGLAVAHGS